MVHRGSATDPNGAVQTFGESAKWTFPGMPADSSVSLSAAESTRIRAMDHKIHRESTPDLPQVRGGAVDLFYKKNQIRVDCFWQAYVRCELTFAG